MSNRALGEAIRAAKRRYSERRPASHAEWLRAIRAMPGGNTRSILFFDPFPTCVARGEGCFVYDVDGHRYVDLVGEYSAGIYGHSNSVIQEAIAATLRNGINLSAQGTAESDLSGLICERFPAIESLRFCNSGTEANLLAVATAMAFTQRRRVLVFEGAYHGSVLRFGGAPSALNVPHDFLVVPYNDTEGARGAIRAHARELACVLVEPMLGAGGCIPGDPAFLHTLAIESRAAGALLIFDEIQTSRLSIGGRQHLLDIKPDLTTLGKYLGGGLSSGAFGGRADVMALYDPRRPGHLVHAGTFNNNALSMTAGYEGLSRLLTAGALEALNGRGDRLRDELNAMLEEYRSGLAVRGLGSLMSFYARRDDAHGSSAVELLFFELLERGYYCAPRGFIALSLAVDDEALGGFRGALRDVLDSHASLL